MTFALQAELLDEVSVQTSARFITDPNFGAQEKENGKRRVIVRSGNQIFCFNREGEKRDVPRKLVAVLLKHPVQQFVIDGEMLGTVISPRYTIFDALILGDEALAEEIYEIRERRAHETFDGFHPSVKVSVTARTQEDKMALVERLYNEQAEGVVFKNMRAVYRQGESHQHFKLKFWKTADCVVIGPSPVGHDSVEIGVYLDNGVLHRVSGVSLIGRDSVTSGDVVEVKYLYATRDRHIVQPVMLRKRDDKKAERCTVRQLVVNRDMQ